MRGRLLAVVGGLGCSPPATPLPPVPLALAALRDPAQPAVIAHRGGAALGPEETVDTMRRSLAAGATVLELDVHLTADGVPVLLHDATVDRTTSGTGAVVDLTYAEVRALDAGEGQTIAHLVDPLRAFPEVPFILELKGDHPELVPVVLDVLRDEDALSRVILASFHSDRLDVVRAAPEAPTTGLAVGEVAEWLWHEGDPSYRPPGAFVQLPPSVPGLDLITAEHMAWARAAGLSVQAWTINDPVEAVRLSRLGVSGILTDAPDRISVAVSAPDARGPR